MSDFVEFEPTPAARRAVAVTVRAARADDVPGLAAVRAARGGTVEEHLEPARHLIERLPVLLVAESADSGEQQLVGWGGAHRAVLHHDSNQEWLVAGLTVAPSCRRGGVGRRLLAGVVEQVRLMEPTDPVDSIVNATNLASIALHERLGFAEVARGASFAGITFTGGEGVLLRRAEISGTDDR